ncbi:MAG TPA: molybdenum cofactor cytidylyltransferase [Acidobacteriaceae bacterium]|nr:molybdenum cofactor cytidylyltransferase [Acidobacteriaceae bacterium]
MDADDRVSQGCRVGAVVLAAGRSARMGEIKQLLPLDGRMVLERTLANVRGSAVDEVVLVLGHAAEEIRQQLPAKLLDNVTLAMNQEFAEGMSSSLRVGLAALGPQMDAAMIVLGDQPLVRPETMDRIIQKYSESNAEIVVPHYRGKRGNPVLLDRTLFPEAMTLEGDTGFRTLFGRHAEGLVATDVDDVGVLLDIDSREDYTRLLDRLG